MDKETLIEKLKEMDLPYEVDDYGAGERVYVFGKQAFAKKQKQPKKYKDLYVPYCRIGFMAGGEIYVRDNGLCDYVNEQQLIEILNKLAAE